jgi:hypothetical protein
MMRKIHYLSGLVITTFVGIHLLNHLCGIISPEKHIEVMNALRPFYRNVVIETLLLFAVLLQIFSGLKLFFSRQNKVSARFEHLHIWTGLYLAIFFSYRSRTNREVYTTPRHQFLLWRSWSQYIPVQFIFCPLLCTGITIIFWTYCCYPQPKKQKKDIGIAAQSTSKCDIAHRNIDDCIDFLCTDKRI